MTAPVTSAYFDEVLTDFDFGVASPAVCAEDTTALQLTAINAVPVPATPSTPTPLATERDAFYASLEARDAATLQATAARINNCRQIARESTLEIGRELVAIKDSIPGHFDRWLKLEFNMSKATAWNYINVVQEFGDAPEVVDVLPSATAYRLAAKATPENVRREIVEEIKTGAAPTKADVERRIADGRRSADEEKRVRKQVEREQAEAARQQLEDEQAWQARRGNSPRLARPKPKSVKSARVGMPPSSRRSARSRFYLKPGRGSKKSRGWFMRSVVPTVISSARRPVKRPTFSATSSARTLKPSDRSWPMQTFMSSRGLFLRALPDSSFDRRCYNTKVRRSLRQAFALADSARKVSSLSAQIAYGGLGLAPRSRWCSLAAKALVLASELP